MPDDTFENEFAADLTQPEHTDMQDEIVPEEAEKEEVVTIEAKPLLITARQFTKARKLRWERAAGFLHYAKIKFGENQRFSVAEWTTHWDAFWSRPAERPIKED
jgi:hypothetical protein